MKFVNWSNMRGVSAFTCDSLWIRGKKIDWKYCYGYLA